MTRALLIRALRLALATALWLTAASSDAARPGTFELVSTAGLGDELSCLAIGHRDPRFMLVGTVNGKILRSVDGGASWQQVTVTPFRELFFGRERQEDSRFEYALGLPGHSPLLQRWLRSKGLHTSGINMQQLLVQKGDKIVNITWIDIDWNDERRVYVATTDGLYVSFDKARTFIRTFQGTTSMSERMLYTVGVDPFDSKLLMLGSASGLFVSRDRGATFRKEMNFYIRDSPINGLFFDPQFQGLVHMAMSGAAMASPDGGKNWITTHWDEWAPRATATWIALGPDNVRAMGTHDGLFASWQGGEYGTWKRRGARFVAKTIISVMITKDPNVWYVLTEDAVWRSADAGATWYQVMEVGGGEYPRWLAAFENDENQLWLLTNRHLYRLRTPETAVAARAPTAEQRRLLDMPDLYTFWRKTQHYKHVYFTDNQNYRNRAPWAAILPDLTVTASYQLGRDVRMFKAFPYFFWPYLYHNRLDDTVPGISIMATWELGRLIMDRRQLPNFGRVERNLDVIRRDLGERVLRLYTEYRSVAHRLVYNPPADMVARQYDLIRLQEIAAFFDIVSGGYWSKATGGLL